MKERFKGFVLGAAVTLLAGALTAPVLADTIDALFNRLNIQVNGVPFASAGESYILSNGTVVPYSILYKNTTYLPLAKLTEALNAEARWDASTSTAVITGGLASCYPNTAYRTFSDVTGAPLEAYFKNSGEELYVYRLFSDESDNAALYMSYLMDSGFEIYDTAASAEDFSTTYMLVKELDIFFLTCYFQSDEVWLSFLTG